MELNNEREPQETTNGSNEDGTTLSEHALRQLSKSLMTLIPNNVDSLEDDAFGYKFHRPTEGEY